MLVRDSSGAGIVVPWTQYQGTLMNKPLVIILAIALIFAACALATPSAPVSESPSPMPTLTLSIQSLSNDLKAGDPVPIEFSVKNIGASDYAYLDRNYDRAGRMPEYELKCVSESGQRIDDPRKNYPIIT